MLPVLWCREGYPVEIDRTHKWPKDEARGAVIIVRSGVAYVSCGVVTLNGQEFTVLFEQTTLERWASSEYRPSYTAGPRLVSADSQR